MQIRFVTLFAEPVPPHAHTNIHPDGSVHYAVEGRNYFAGFLTIAPDGEHVVILARPYAVAVISGSLNQVLRRYLAAQPPCIN
jgi:hypothetical protein